MTTNLLKLPVELRFQIFELVLLAYGPTVPPTLVVPSSDYSSSSLSSAPSSASPPLTNTHRDLLEPLENTVCDDDLAAESWVEADDVRYFSWSRGENVLYQNDGNAYRSNATALLMVNRQCHSEVKALIRTYISSSSSCSSSLDDVEGQRDYHDVHPSPSLLLSHEAVRNVTTSAVKRPISTPIKYHLDIALTSAGAWRLRWRHVPVKVRCVDELCVTFTNLPESRSVKSGGEISGSSRMLFERNSGESPSVGWMLWSLLERYLKVGVCAPRGVTADSVRGSTCNVIVDDTIQDEYSWYETNGTEFAIKTLTFDIQPEVHGHLQSRTHKGDEHDTSQPDYLNVSYVEMMRRLANLPLQQSPNTTRLTPSSSGDYDNPINEICRVLFAEMSSVLKLALYEEFDKSVFYKRIERIRVCRVGEVVHEWDLGHVLRPLQERHELFFREGDSWRWMQARTARSLPSSQWWKDTNKARKTLGFSAIAFEDDSDEGRPP